MQVKSHLVFMKVKFMLLDLDMPEFNFDFILLSK